MAVCYILMFEQAHALDSHEDEDEQHFVADLDAILNHEPEDDEAVSPEDAAETQREQIEAMRQMASMVNEAMGGKDG